MRLCEFLFQLISIFLSFESQCQTKPYDKALTRLQLADPKHPSFEPLLIELYSNFNARKLKKYSIFFN